jgi:hypothetical protein
MRARAEARQATRHGLRLSIKNFARFLNVYIDSGASFDRVTTSPPDPRHTVNSRGFQPMGS